jgi:hypothetical protein
LPIGASSSLHVVPPIDPLEESALSFHVLSAVV